MNNIDLKQILLKLDGPHCFNCTFHKDYPNAPSEIHHVLIHRNKKYMAWLDNPINICLICRDCHSAGRVNSHEWRVEFLHKRIWQLGIEVVREWWNSLPDKLKMTNAWIGIELEEK